MTIECHTCGFDADTLTAEADYHGITNPICCDEPADARDQNRAAAVRRQAAVRRACSDHQGAGARVGDVDDEFAGMLVFAARSQHERKRSEVDPGCIGCIDSGRAHAQRDEPGIGGRLGRNALKENHALFTVPAAQGRENEPVACADGRARTARRFVPILKFRDIDGRQAVAREQSPVFIGGRIHAVAVCDGCRVENAEIRRAFQQRGDRKALVELNEPVGNRVGIDPD